MQQVGFVILRDTISVNIDHDFSFTQIVTSMIWCFEFFFHELPDFAVVFLEFSAIL